MAKSKLSIVKTNDFKMGREKKLREYIHTFGSNEHKESEDLVLYNCGLENCPKGHYFGPLSRDFHIIHFVTEGEGTLTIDHVTYPVGKNQAFVIPANKVAKYEASKTNPWKYYWFGFIGIKAREYIYQIMNTRETPVIIDIEDLSTFKEAIQTMVEVGKSGISLKNHFILQGNMYHLLAALVETTKPVTQHTTAEAYIFQAQTYINKNFAQPIQIATIANKLGLHPNYLTAIYKKYTNTTPKEYLMKVRMAKAVDFLLHTNYQMKIVARSVGYTDSLAFSKAFRKYYGVSPKEYRGKKI